jgi:predicted O-linked N-acetylglucosamine transferase (SPINDLY family)
MYVLRREHDKHKRKLFIYFIGSKSEEEINAEIEENVSNNTKKTRESIWKLHSFVKNYRWDH